MTARRYRAIFESAVDFAIIAMDREGIVTDWNPGAEQILGWTEEEMKGQPASRFFTRQDNELHIAEGEMATALAEGRASDERWHRKSDGALFWASGEMMPLRDDDGGHLGFLKILRDRTEQRLAAEAQAHAEEALRQGEERWRNLFEQMHEGFFVGEAVRDDKGRMVDFRFLEINAAFQEQTGIKGALNRTIREMTPDMPAEAIATYAAVVDTGEPAQFEIQVESLVRGAGATLRP